LFLASFFIHLVMLHGRLCLWVYFRALDGSD